MNRREMFVATGAGLAASLGLKQDGKQHYYIFKLMILRKSNGIVAPNSPYSMAQLYLCSCPYSQFPEEQICSFYLNGKMEYLEKFHHWLLRSEKEAEMCCFVEFFKEIDDKLYHDIYLSAMAVVEFDNNNKYRIGFDAQHEQREQWFTEWKEME